MPPADLLAFAQRYTAAWCSQNAASVAAHFAPNGSLQINTGAPSIGRDDITTAAQSFMTAFPDLTVTLDRLTATPAGIECHWTLTGTHAATSRPVHISGFELWTFSPDGLIAASLGHFDEADYNRQSQLPANP